jgi:hypothetical protein
MSPRSSEFWEVCGYIWPEGLRRKGSRNIDHEDLIRYESIMKFLKRDWLNFLRPVHYESNKQHDSRNRVELALLYILVNMHVQRTISNIKTS